MSGGGVRPGIVLPPAGPKGDGQHIRSSPSRRHGSRGTLRRRTRRRSGRPDVLRLRPRLGPRRRAGQYGAYGYALHGWTRPDRRPLLPGHRRSARRRSSAFACCSSRLESASSSLRPRRSRCATRPARRTSCRRQAAARPGLKLKLAASAKALPGAARLLAGRGAARSLGGRAYRGTLRVTGGKASGSSTRSASSSTSGASCRRRCRDTWPAEALKSQAIVARTYALAHLQTAAATSTSTRTRAARSTAGSPPSRPAARRRRRHRRPGRALQGRARRDVLLLELRRPDGERPGRLGRRSRRRTSSPCPTRTTRSRPTTTGAR